MTMGVSITPMVVRINGRPVLQPTCNGVPSLDRRNSIKKKAPQALTPPPPPPPPPPPLPQQAACNKASLTTPPISPKSNLTLKSPRPPAIKRGNDPNALNSSSEKVVTPGGTTSRAKLLERKKSKSFKGVISVGDHHHDGGGDIINYGGFGGGVSSSSSSSIEASLSYSSSLITDAPGSIAAVRREHMALQHAERKMRIAHYGRSKSAKFEKGVPLDSSTSSFTNKTSEEEKRCSFITPNSGIYFFCS